MSRNPLSRSASINIFVMRPLQPTPRAPLSPALEFPYPRGQFVEAHRDSLPQIHRNIFLVGGNANQPMAMAQSRFESPNFSDPKRSATRPAASRLRISVHRPRDRETNGATAGDAPPWCRPPACSPRPHRQHYRTAPRPQHIRRAHRRTRLAKRRLIRFHHSQAAKTEVAHRACGRADIQRVARSHEDHAQAIGFRRLSQGPPILKQSRPSSRTNSAAKNRRGLSVSSALANRRVSFLCDANRCRLRRHSSDQSQCYRIRYV